MSKKSLLIVGIGLSLVIVAGFFGYASLLRIKYRADSAFAHFRRVEATMKQSPADLLRKDTLNDVIADMAAAEASLASIKKEPILSLLGFAGWAPGVGAQASAVSVLLEASLDMASAGRLAGEGMRPIVEVTGLGGTLNLFGDNGFNPELIAAMASGRPKFDASAKKLETASQRLKELNPAELQRELGDTVKRLDSWLSSLDGAVELGRSAPELTSSILGMDKPKRYLVISQNNEELRATGGFISGVWLLTIDKGKIIQLDFKDSPDVDDMSKRYPPPPPAISKYMWGGVWLFRDANWSPDFPTSARLIEDFYGLGQEVSVDGVVGLDQQALEAILSVTGPIFVRDFQEWVDASNVVDKIVRAPNVAGNLGPEAMRAKKLFMAALFQELLSRIQGGLDVNTLVKLGGLLGQKLEEKHLLMYFNDAAVQSLLHRSQQDGSIRPSEADYLMVVDSNVAYRKLNARIAESINYDVSLDKEGEAKGKVAISYTNKSTEKIAECIQDTIRGATYEQWREGCYWDYVRVYAPSGARLFQRSHIPMPRGSFWSRLGKAAPGDETILAPPEEGKDVFDAFFDLAPGASREVFFSYGLPASVVTGTKIKRYELLVQKQPGTSAIPVRIGVSLPPGAKLVFAEPTPQKATAGRVDFQTDLTRDRKFAVTFSTE